MTLNGHFALKSVLGSRHVMGCRILISDKTVLKFAELRTLSASKM